MKKQFCTGDLALCGKPVSGNCKLLLEVLLPGCDPSHCVHDFSDGG